MAKHTHILGVPGSPDRISILVFMGILGLLLWSGSARAQESVGKYPSQAKRSPNIKWTQFNISYDNDFLNWAGRGTDNNYTAGLNLEAFYQRRTPSKFFLDHMLISLPESSQLFFYGMTSRLYTPTDISNPQISYGDRPYASVLYFTHGLVSVNKHTHEYLSSCIGVGAMGAVTMGGDFQSWFHQLIGYRKPQGWQYQTSNSLVLDYRLYYERSILRPADQLQVLGNIDCEFGTLVDNMGLGITVAVGQLGQFFTRDHAQANPVALPKKGCHFQVFMHPELRMVLFDATLEGGFFSSNTYVLDKSDLEYLYFQYDMGLMVSLGRFRIGLTQKMRTPEFKGGKIHQVGNVTFTVPL